MTITYTFENTLYINLTNRCTNNCDFCVRTTEDGYYGDLWLEREPTVAEICADIDKRDLESYDELVFCGYGEPTMRLDDLLEVAAYIRSKSPIRIRVNTNGLANMYFKRDVTPKFSGLIDTLSISLCAANAEHYNSICHSCFGIAAYDGMLDFTKKATAYVEKVVFTVVDTTLPPEDIEKCRDIAASVGAVLRVREFIG